jgi:hypothetical protein
LARRPVERFVGQLSTTAIRSTIGPKVGAFAVFEKWLEPRPVPFGDVENEVRDLLHGWRTAFGDPPGTHANEKLARVDLTPELLRRWFDDSMLQQPVHIADLQKASVVDLLRLLDYPNDYVPVLTRHFDPQSPAPQQQASERVDVLDKTALNARLARSYLVELMDRARLKWRCFWSGFCGATATRSCMRSEPIANECHHVHEHRGFVTRTKRGVAGVRPRYHHQASQKNLGQLC